MEDDELREKIDEIRNYVENNLKADLKVCTLAKKFDIPVKTLQDNFKYYCGCTLKEYINKKRLERLELIIKTVINPGLYSEYYYAREIGLKSSACLSNFLKKMTGMTFLEFCNKVRNET